MKEQYVGDINDYRKYALLRALAGNGEVNIGVCWMLTPSDGKADGNRLGYLRKPAFRMFDPPLFDLLTTVMDAPDQRRLVLIKESGIIPGAIYHNAVLPTPVAERENYFNQALSVLGSCHLIFYDPDNGLDVPSRRKGRAGSNRYIYRDEIARTYAAGHSMLIYQHFPHEEHGSFTKRLGDELANLCDESELWTFTTSHVVFFLVARPEHRQKLGSLAESAALRWPSSFIAGAKISREDQSRDDRKVRPVSVERGRKPPLLSRMLSRLKRL